jgi:hypothetical protein
VLCFFLVLLFSNSIGGGMMNVMWSTNGTTVNGGEISAQLSTTNPTFAKGFMINKHVT